MDRPRVSIITATFNRSQVLRHTIASVIRQRFGAWELLVVGDACTDDTREVVASFGDPRIHYHALSENVGEQSGPNNHGVIAARGDLLAFVNHDDLWMPDHLEVSLMAAIIPGHPPALSNFTPSGRYEPRTVVPASSWVFRRSLSERVGPWRSYRECYQAPSQDWLCRAEQAGSDSRLVPALTVVAFPSGYRHGSYTSNDDTEQVEYLARMTSDPVFRERLLTEMVLGQAAGGPYTLSTTAVRPYLSRAVKNAVSAALSAAGVPPASVRLFMTSPRRGHFIETLRRTRGLPPLSRERTD